MRRVASHWAFRDVPVKPEALLSLGTSDEGLAELAVRDEVAGVTEERALLEAERVDGAERAGRQLRVLEPELLLDAVGERRVGIGVAGAQAPRELAHGRLLVLRGGFATLSSDAGGVTGQVEAELAREHVAQRDGAQLRER
jgi:hypothetical protein